MKSINKVIKGGKDQSPEADFENPKLESLGVNICDPECPICGGFGWCRRDLPVSDPNFGRMVLCQNVKVYNLIGKKSGLDPKELHLEWDSLFDINGVSIARAAAEKLLQRGAGWLYLWGDPGLAKTLILKIIVAKALHQNKQAVYTRFASILDYVRDAFDHGNESALSRLDWYAELPLLAIDEADRFKESEWATERRFILLDRRYEEACRGKSMTVFASNASPETMPDYIKSRIFDGRFDVIKLVGDDVRPAERWYEKED